MWYDPLAPQHAVLERGLPPSYWNLWLFLQPFLAAGCALLLLLATTVIAPLAERRCLDGTCAPGWTIPTQTVIWAAGNVASPLLRCLNTPLDQVGRAIVEPDCTIPGHPEVFVLGDAAAFPHPKGGTLPGISPVAIQMGQYAARVIEGDLAGRPRRAFSYWDKGQLAVIGRGQAVADIWKLRFGGLVAWLIWIFVHVFFLIGFRNRVLVLLQWAWSYVTYSRGARLITEEVHPTGAPLVGCPAPTP